MEPCISQKAEGYPVSTISSDSEACPDNSNENEDNSYHGEESSQPKTSEFHETVNEYEGCDDTGSTPSKKVYRRKTVKREVQVKDTEHRTGTVEKKGKMQCMTFLSNRPFFCPG